MTIENLESRPVPAGLGLHPFFTRDADTELACRVEGVWRADADVLPIDRIAVPPEWSFADSRPLDDVVLDNCFDGWDGRAAIRWPRRGLGLTLEATEPFRHLVIYVPKGRPHFCVEPASHANGAVARALLPAGATLAGEIASFPWRGVVNDRRSVYAGLGLGLAEALAVEDELGRDTIFADGFQDGVARFDAHQATRER
jgi:aldose 1-epimerase